MPRYAIQTIRINKLHHRFEPDGEILEEGWVPIAAFFGTAEPWLVLIKRVDRRD